MSDEIGMYTQEAQPCNHPEQMELASVTLCPRCDTYIIAKGKEIAAANSILNELINIQHFDTANVVYTQQLERALKDLRKFVNY